MGPEGERVDSLGELMGLRWERILCTARRTCLCRFYELKKLRRRFLGGEALGRAEHQAEQAWTTRKTVRRKNVGHSWKADHCNLSAEVPEVAPECALARGADDVNMGDKMDQR